MPYSTLRVLFMLWLGAVPAFAHAQTSEQDETARQMMIGTWIVPRDSLDFTGEPSRDVYRADGTTSFYIYKTDRCLDVVTTVDGTWDIKSGILTATITKTSDPQKFPAGMTAKAQVMSFEMQRVVLRALPAGQKYTRERSTGCVPGPPKKEAPEQQGFGLGTD